MAKTNQPVSSFGAELQATLRKGAQQELEIRFDTPALAIRFRQRINALRKALKDSNHADWEQMYRCGVYIDPKDPRILRLAPRDSEFRSFLQAAGVGVEAPLPTTVVEVSTPAPGTAPDAADDFLSTLREATTIPKGSENEND